MHILLTDILTCPQCGPDYGLILLADRIEERRVIKGQVGCANCRRTYPIEDGVVDFRGETGRPQEFDEPVPRPAGDVGRLEREVDRLAALLGVVRGPAFLLLAGPATANARALADMLDEVEVITVSAERGAGSPGVNPLLVDGERLPLARSKVAGVALTGAAADLLLEEAARTIEPGGRLVLDPVPSGAPRRLEPLGMRVAAQESTTAVAVRG